MINLITLPGNYSIYQINDKQKIPSEIFDSGFYSITKTSDEVSIVSDCNVDFENCKRDSDWRGFKVEGILDFSLIGIINDLTKPLKDKQISVFVISTFNTDYIFVKGESFNMAMEIFNEAENINFKVSSSPPV
jgi:hypothetical protein